MVGAWLVVLGAVTIGESESCRLGRGDGDLCMMCCFSFMAVTGTGVQIT